MISYFGIVFCIVGVTVVIGFVFIAASIRIVKEDTRLAVYRLGRYIGDKGPGVVVLIPFIDRATEKKAGSTEVIYNRGVAGEVGETITTVHTDGKVLLGGEEWNAVSQSPISAGQRVRVVRMILEVENE